VVVIAAIIDYIAAITLGLWGILHYPIKRALKKKKERRMLPKKSDNVFKWHCFLLFVYIL